jgi:sugar O-acyltransferase (sialic acid O-acetyltransferase NeuD family)
MKRLAIIGSGDLGEQVAWLSAQTGEYQMVGFYDDFTQAGSIKHGHPILGSISDITSHFQSNKWDCLFIGIGYKHMQTRQELYERFSTYIPFATLIHPNAFVDSSASVGSGSILYPGCVVDMKSTIGNNTLLNAGCVIAHDTHVGSHCFLSPAVKIAGFVTVESQVSIGIGAILIDNLNIASGTKIGAGAIVLKTIFKKGVYFGVPATLKKAL